MIIISQQFIGKSVTGIIKIYANLSGIAHIIIVNRI